MSPRTYLGRTTTKAHADLDALWTLATTEPPGVYDATEHGLVADGVTDNTAALNALLAVVYAAGGGTINFPAKPLPFLFLGQILLPNNNAAIPAQPFMRLRGGGGSAAGQTSAIPGGGVLDLRYAGATAKIVTLGLGTLEIESLTLKDDGLSSTPFLLTTNTTLKVHDNRFNGNPSKTGNTCDQDAIILGGTTTALDGTTNSAFQGYGSIIRENSFNRIRRATYHRVYCNDVKVRDNWVMHDCGSNLVGGAAFEVDGIADTSASGNVFQTNTIETPGYTYPIKFVNSIMNASLYNGFYDDNVGGPTAFHRVEASSFLNLIIMGFGSDAKPTLSENGAAVGTTTVFTGHQGQPSQFPQGVDLRGVSRFLTGEGPQFIEDVSGDYWQQVIDTATKFDQNYKPSAGALEQFWSMIRITATIKALQLHGDELRFLGNGKIQLLAGAGAELWLGGDAAAAWIMNAAKQLQYIGGSATPFAMGASRATVTGSRGGNAALASLLTGLSTMGLVIDNSTA